MAALSDHRRSRWPEPHRIPPQSPCPPSPESIAGQQERCCRRIQIPLCSHVRHLSVPFLSSPFPYVLGFGLFLSQIFIQSDPLSLHLFGERTYSARFRCGASCLIRFCRNQQDSRCCKHNPSNCMQVFLYRICNLFLILCCL